MDHIPAKWYVDNEIGDLIRVIIHRPDKGIGKIIPKKAQEWLYEDIVDIDIMQQEYDYFYKVLLAFLDPPVLDQWLKFESSDRKNNHNLHFLDTGSKPLSEKVWDIQGLLAEILKNTQLRSRIVASVCGIEGCSFHIQQHLLNELKGYKAITPHQLAEILLTGILCYEENNIIKEKFIFPPVPNFVFTRDLGVMVYDNMLLSKTAWQARARETILIKYIANYFLFKNNPEKIIEIVDEDETFLLDEKEKQNQLITLEGGDVMMIAPGHLIIGCSERTSPSGINKIIDYFFKSRNSQLYKISVITLPKKREVMHIDTVFTMIKRNFWVIYDVFEKKYKKESFYPFTEQSNDNTPYIIQYRISNDGILSTYHFSSLKAFLVDISVEDFNCKKEEVKFIEGGDGIFPFNEREQWMDACNLLAVKEGVVIGYDRNFKTIEAFRRNGFKILHAESLIKDIGKGKSVDELVEQDSLILLPSSELSRARGGSHCMTMPLLRKNVY